MEKIKPVLKGPGFLATGNAGKLREIIPLCSEYFQIDPSLIEGWPPTGAIESEDTFAGNALIKSRYVYEDLKRAGKTQGLDSFWILSDDSGLSVDALGGLPGVRSARYAGDHVSSEAHIQKLLQALKESKAQPPFHAHYSCALSLIVCQNSSVREHLGEGECHGEIVFEAQGDSGFGYDPIFYVPAFGKTFAQIPYEQKNSISHRRRAFEALQKTLLAFALFLIPFTSSAQELAPAERSFREFMKVITRDEQRVEVPMISPNTPPVLGKSIDPQTFSNQKLLQFYSKHLSTRNKLRWELTSIGKDKELPAARPDKTYFNTHVFKVYRNDTLVKIYRPVDTTTGCDSACAPVSFHLAYDPREKTIELLEDPNNPLQKTGHTPWSQEDKKKMQSVLKSLPTWFVHLPSPSFTTEQGQTWPLYKETLVAGAAYTSYRILEAALQLLEFSKIRDFQKHSEELARLSNLVGDAFRVQSTKDAHALYEKLSTKAQSLIESRLQAGFKSLLLAWLVANDPQFTPKDLAKALGKTPFTESPSLSCFVLEESFITPSSAKKLLSAIQKTPSLGKTLQELCPRLPMPWLEVLAGKPLSADLKSHISQSFALPELLSFRPHILQALAQSLLAPEDRPLQKRIFSFLKARHPRLEIAADQVDAALVNSFVDQLKQNYLASLGPHLGVLPSTQLSTIQSQVKFPVAGKEVYIFFASWCPHCEHLLSILKREIQDPKLWKKIQLVENFSSANSLDAAQALCKKVELPAKTCQEMLLVPNDRSSESLASKLNLFSVPRVIITDPKGKIVDFDFKFEERPEADPLRKLHWILER